MKGTALMATHGGIEHGGTRDNNPDGLARSRQVPVPSAEFFGWVRSQGIRRGSKRWLGGVASGTAIRMGVPVAAVRTAFVALSLFSGLGLFLYGLAWALLPGDDGRIHAEQAAHGKWSAGMTGAALMALLGLSGTYLSLFEVPSNNWWTYWPLTWLAAVVYLISAHSRAGTAGRSRPRPAAPHVRPNQHRPADPGNPLVAVVSGIAFIVAGVTLFLASGDATDVSRQAVALAWAAAAAVLGLGIVAAGLAGRSSGILGFLAVAALVAAALSGGFNALGNVAVGRTFSWAPESTGQLMDGYSIAAGSGQLDLTSLTGTGPLPSDTTVAINTAASTVAILIPADNPVRINSQVAFSTVQDNLGGNTTGIWNPHEHTYSPDAPGGTLVLDLRGAFSTISIKGPS
ncbi:PspC domain-containing protein [Pseudarthrobacter sp. RMG13]|uniref:PspC domain-containing protein n=1 Tax=Pseudarthrobacter humi TaxID=2952523 RepID=A0ABT1LLS6_9MICC|nr:PspC domain-containing protein [Pseudarthrobacter humi]MCP8999408.1 PspC domain-containing protein [Pseudarthrobacter humi]